MTFYGESAPLDWANVTTGSPFADDGDALRFRDGSATVTAGDVFVAGFFDSTYLAPGDEATFAVAVVHTGGSGTLRLSGGPDPEFDLDETDASTYALGDHAVSGSGTLVVSLPWVTVADYLDQAVETAVRVEVLSGSVTLQQVKLRIWPPGGAVGYWSDTYPGWASGGFTLAASHWDETTILDSGTQSGGSPEAAWDAANAAVTFDDTIGPTFSLTASTTVTGTSEVNFPGGVTWEAQHAGTGVVQVVVGVDWRTAYPINGLVEGVDFIIPPDEVPGDASSTLVQQIGDGSTEWTGITEDADLSAATDLIGWTPVLHSEGSDSVDIVPLGGGFSTVTGAGYTSGAPVGLHGGSPTTAPVTLSHGGARYIIVSRGYTYTPQSWPGWFPNLAGTSESESVNFGLSFPDIASRAVLPPYRVWSPTAAPQNYMRVMQRGDGLGMGSGRVLGPGTRQASNRVIGTL
jgi:hypothetical protein